MNYYITKHAVERLKERFEDLWESIPQFKNWNKWKDPNKFKSIFNEWIVKSKENRSYINNTSKMIEFYEKYGYDTDYKFLECPDEKILFIFTKGRQMEKYALVTLVELGKRVIKKYEYKQREKKENKVTQRLLSKYEKEYTSLITSEHLIQEKLLKEFLNKKGQHDNLNLEKRHSIVIGDKKYTFKYNEKEYFIENKIKIIDVSPISEDGIKEMPYDGELKDTILFMLANNKIHRLIKYSAKKSLCYANINDVSYEFIYIKGAKELFMQSIYTVVNNDKQEEYLKEMQLNNNK